MTTKFYVCPVCGNVIVKLVDSGVTPSCCGQTMKELVPNTTDGKVEAHVPVFERTSPGTIMVSIGSTPHPMTREHRDKTRWPVQVALARMYSRSSLRLAQHTMQGLLLLQHSRLVDVRPACQLFFQELTLPFHLFAIPLSKETAYASPGFASTLFPE